MSSDIRLGEWDGEAWGRAHTANRFLHQIRGTWEYPNRKAEYSVWEELQENQEIQELVGVYQNATTDKKRAIAEKQLEVLLRKVFSYLLTQ